MTSEQHYGTAPCGCERWQWGNSPYGNPGEFVAVRGHEPEIHALCGEHRCAAGHLTCSSGYPLPWHAASAIEHFCRAVEISSLNDYATQLRSALDVCAEYSTAIELAFAEFYEPVARMTAGALCAAAIEQGLRAIAGWPICTCGKARGCLLHNPPMPRGACFDPAQAQAVPSLGKLARDIDRVYEIIRGSRTTCYFCGKSLANGACREHPNQPPGGE